MIVFATKSRRHEANACTLSAAGRGKNDVRNSASSSGRIAVSKPARFAVTNVPISRATAGGIRIDPGVDNGPTYYYKVTGTNIGGESPRSAEAGATPEGPPLVVDAETQAAFRFLRQATWGPRPGDVDHVKLVGRTPNDLPRLRRLARLRTAAIVAQRFLIT